MRLDMMEPIYQGHEDSSPRLCWSGSFHLTPHQSHGSAFTLPKFDGGGLSRRLFPL